MAYGQANVTCCGSKVPDKERFLPIRSYKTTVGRAFGGVATLEGVAAPAVARAGERVEVRLWWRALGAADRDYTAFVHLVGPADERPAPHAMVANVDGVHAGPQQNRGGTGAEQYVRARPQLLVDRKHNMPRLTRGDEGDAREHQHVDSSLSRGRRVEPKTGDDAEKCRGNRRNGAQEAFWIPRRPP